MIDFPAVISDLESYFGESKGNGCYISPCGTIDVRYNEFTDEVVLIQCPWTYRVYLGSGTTLSVREALADFVKNTRQQ